MADEEVTVGASAERPRKRKYPGMSPLQAGLTYGGAAATVMGPLGLLIGLGSGIAAKRMRDSWLDREAENSRNLRAEYQGVQQELDGEIRIADPDEKRLLEHAKRVVNEGWNRLAQGDEGGRALIEKGNEIARGIMNADIAARKSEQASQAQFQRGLIGTAAQGYRDEYQKNLKEYEDVNSLADRVLKLAAASGFDPNKPFNKAVMTDLLTVGVGGLYRDAPDMLGSLPVVGEFLERGKDALTGKFDLTAEDYNRIALGMKSANEQVSESRMLRLGDQARSLDEFARQNGAIPEDYSLGLYVTGEEQELRFTPVPQPAPTEKLLRDKEASYKYQDPISKSARELEQWMNQRNSKKKPRPTN